MSLIPQKHLSGNFIQINLIQLISNKMTKNRSGLLIFLMPSFPSDENLIKNPIVSPTKLCWEITPKSFVYN